MRKAARDEDKVQGTNRKSNVGWRQGGRKEGIVFIE